MRVPNLLLVLALAVLLVGCGQQQSYKDINYYEGSEGVTMELVDNSPPEKVYPGQLFSITARFDNQGAFSFTSEPGGEVGEVEGYANVVFDPLYFKEDDQSVKYLKRTRNNLSFTGKSPEWPTGEDRFVTLAIMEVKPLIGRSGADTPITVSWCYPYETLLTTQVCIDRDPTDVEEGYVLCEAQDIPLVDQGAPVAVTNLGFEVLPMGMQPVTVTGQESVTDPEGRITGTRLVSEEQLVPIVKPVVRLTIQNVGDGTVIRGRPLGQNLRCDAGREDYPAGSIIIDARLGSHPLLCNNGRPVVFYDDTAEAVCVLDDDEMPVIANYYEILQVRLSYVYQSRVSTTVVIDNSAEQYQPLDLDNYRCSDFNGRYEFCKSYAQRASNINGTSLDCYYCVSSGRCLEGAEACKSSCKDAPSYYEPTRRCVAPCSDKDATVSAPSGFDQRQGLLNLVCRDPAGVTMEDHSRCGCREIKVFFTNDTKLCDESHRSLFSSPKIVSSGSYNQGAGISLSVEVPKESIDGMKAGQKWYACYYGVTVNNDSTNVLKYAMPFDINQK